LVQHAAAAFSGGERVPASRDGRQRQQAAALHTGVQRESYFLDACVEGFEQFQEFATEIYSQTTARI
jgi:hypothetical protein